MGSLIEVSRRWRASVDQQDDLAGFHTLVAGVGKARRHLAFDEAGGQKTIGPCRCPPRRCREKEPGHRHYDGKTGARAPYARSPAAATSEIAPGATPAPHSTAQLRQHCCMNRRIALVMPAIGQDLASTSTAGPLTPRQAFLVAWQTDADIDQGLKNGEAFRAPRQLAKQFAEPLHMAAEAGIVLSEKGRVGPRGSTTGGSKSNSPAAQRL